MCARTRRVCVLTSKPFRWSILVAVLLFSSLAYFHSHIFIFPARIFHLFCSPDSRHSALVARHEQGLGESYVYQFLRIWWIVFYKSASMMWRQLISENLPSLVADGNTRRDERHARATRDRIISHSAYCISAWLFDMPIIPNKKNKYRARCWDRRERKGIGSSGRKNNEKIPIGCVMGRKFQICVELLEF